VEATCDRPKNVTLCGLCLDVDPDCPHDGPRVLPEIRYERIEGTSRLDTRFHVPDSERARISRPSSSWPRVAAKRAPVEAEPLQALIARLDDHVDLDDSLEGLLRDTYAHDPLQTSRLVLSIVGKAESRALTSPGGFLVTRLRQLHRNR
jgi:hypothetical protein